VTKPRERRTARLDLESLAPAAREAVEAMLRGEEVDVRRDGSRVGVATARPAVLEGVVVPAPRREDSPTAAPRDGATVVASVVPMSAAARQRLSDSLGVDYVVLDVTEAPDSADVVLTHPVSPQLIGLLRARFTRARLIITEIEDDELGVNRTGPVSRLLDAGASAYLPPRPIEEVAGNVRTYLEGTRPPQITRADERPHEVT
jgi:hypothetical protein